MLPVPEFSFAERRGRGLWSNGKESLWLRILNILWNHSSVRKCLASGAVLDRARTSALVDPFRSLPRGPLLMPQLIGNVPAQEEDDKTEGLKAKALLIHLLRRAIASASTVDCAGGGVCSRAANYACSGSCTASGEELETHTHNEEVNAAESLYLKSLHDTPSQIPPLLHFVWCGRKPLPEFFIRFKHSWKKYSPLAHALWRDADIEELLTAATENVCSPQRPYQCQENVPVTIQDSNGRQESVTSPYECGLVSGTIAQLAHMAGQERRVGAKSDLVRLLLLHLYGGVYADVDMELIRELPACFFTSATFFAGAQREDAVELGNALLACTPRHELLTYVITQIVEDNASPEEDAKTQALRLVESSTGDCLLHRQEEHVAPLVRTNREAMEVIRCTGPGQLTRAVMRWLELRAPSVSCGEEADCRRQKSASAPHVDLASVCICPPCVFYPVPNHARNALSTRDAQSNAPLST